MARAEKILCTICARGGSKGVPGKNIRPLLGKPLIAYSIEQALAAGVFSAIAISSDSDEILAAAKNCGADMLVKRPPRLATDKSGKIPAIAHALRTAEKQTGGRYDLVVDLAVTSPLRSSQDILAALRLQKKTGCATVVSGTQAHSSPYFSMVESKKAGGVVHVSKKLPGKKILRRQDAPHCYDLNGAVYIWQRDALLADTGRLLYNDTRLYLMPRERSLDIDDELDFLMAEFLMQREGKA